MIPKDTDSGLLHSTEGGIVGFNFNNIFDIDATQEEVFSAIAEQKVVDVFRGLNSTIVSTGLAMYGVFVYITVPTPCSLTAFNNVTPCCSSPMAKLALGKRSQYLVVTLFSNAALFHAQLD